MFQITSQPIIPAELQQTLCLPQSGGFVCFEGWVRNHNDGRAVEQLEYEVYHALAIKEGEKIIAEAMELFAIENAAIVHREGLLAVGDIAVWIGVSAKHRDAAFRAARYLIDEIKLRLPIWKKEYYSDAVAEWVNCQGCAHHHSLHFTPQEYYAKQSNLLGSAGQAKLKQARVLVIGAGGLGSPVLEYLAGAGVGHLFIIDPDRLEPGNLPRQVLYDYRDIGEKKAELAKRRLQSINPFIHVEAFARAFSADDQALLADVDLVVECSDNFKTKFAAHDLCYRSQTPLVMASIYKWEGWLQCFSFAPDRPCLRCIYPEQPLDGCTLNCEEAGVVGTVPGMIGIAQAQMALEYLIDGEFRHEGRKLLFDTQAMRVTPVGLPKNPICPCCGTAERDFHAEYDPESKLERNWSELRERMQQSDPPFIIDIRDENEKQLTPIPSKWDILEMPIAEIAGVHRFNKDTEIYLICARGKRSLEQAAILRDQGFSHIYSVKGGLAAARF